jgi:hypothetical protein
VNISVSVLRGRAHIDGFMKREYLYNSSVTADIAKFSLINAFKDKYLKIATSNAQLLLLM